MYADSRTEEYILRNRIDSTMAERAIKKSELRAHKWNCQKASEDGKKGANSTPNALKSKTEQGTSSF